MIVTKIADTNDGVCDIADCSLREAIGAANALPGADTIVFDASVVPGTFTLTIPGANEDANASGDLDITDDLTINGAATIIDGGGIDRVFNIFFGAEVFINDVTIRNGDAGTSDGGGIRNLPGGTLTLNNSTVSGNTADGSGGIINQGTLTVNNSTVSGNTAAGSGGGIRNVGLLLTLNNSTVSDNSAVAGGGIRGGATLKNTIVANNTAGFGGDCSGIITSAGHNLDSDGSCGLTGTGDIANGNANLGSLALNAPGTTATHALLPGSDAIDAGSPDCPPPATDQRGVARPQGAACDIGAYELVPHPHPHRRPRLQRRRLPRPRLQERPRRRPRPRLSS